MTLLGLLLALVPWIACKNSVTQPDNNQPNKPDWAAIKAGAQPRVLVPDFGPPQRLSIATLGWEDGLYISRDGLHLYAFYAPADMISYSEFFQQNPNCPDITPFLRGPTLNMDLTTNPWGCPNVLHSDIAYANRSSPDGTFAPWRLSGIAEPYRFEGGFVSLENPDGTIDFVYSKSTDNNMNDLFWGRHTNHNPSSASAVPMPSPINTSGQEDNPHLERLPDGSLVLLFDNHGGNDPVTTIRFSMSKDNGTTWSPPVELPAPINSGQNNLHGHLYFDGRDWWLYFASDRNGLLSIFRSRHKNPGKITERFSEWGPVEAVIEPGAVASGGTMIGVGEPTLTRWGDLYFVVVIQATNGNTYDRYDIDPWFVPRL